MRLILNGLMVLGFALLAWSTTPQQARQRWAQFAPSVTGKIVYGQGTKIWVLDLSAGTTKSICNYDMGTTDYGVSCTFRWSPSGTRILVQNPDSVNVLNEDGSNMKRIAKVPQCSDLIWGEWSTDSAVVYSTGNSKKVVRTAIHSNNSPGATVDLVTTTPIGMCWSSVGIDSNWLCYNDIEGNLPTNGYHRPILKNLTTGAIKTLVADNEDMCQLTMIPDKQYKVMGQMSSHMVPATVCDTNGAHITTVPRIGSYPQRAFSWSNQLEYFMCQGENSSQYYAWIRKWSGRTTSVNIIVSDTGSMNMYYPDLWVGSATAIAPAISPISGADRAKKTGVFSLAMFQNQRWLSVYTLAGEKVDINTARSLPAGVYLVKSVEFGTTAGFLRIK